MKRFASNALIGFLGGAIAAAVWSIVTNYIRFGYAPINPLLFSSAMLGAMNALAFAIVHSAFKLQPTLTSSCSSAALPILVGLGLALASGGFVGWSLLSVGAMIVMAALIGWLTHFIATKILN